MDSLLSTSPGIPIIKRYAIIFNVNPDIAIERVKLRHIGSKVPPDVIYRMYGDFLYTLKHIDEEYWDKITMIGEEYGRKTS